MQRRFIQLSGLTHFKPARTASGESSAFFCNATSASVVIRRYERMLNGFKRVEVVSGAATVRQEKPKRARYKDLGNARVNFHGSLQPSFWALTAKRRRCSHVSLIRTSSPDTL